jgi:hypothetical protein
MMYVVADSRHVAFVFESYKLSAGKVTNLCTGCSANIFSMNEWNK